MCLLHLYRSHTHSQLYMCQETYISCPQSYQTVPAPVAIESPTSVSFDAPKFKLTQERAQPLIKWYEDHKDHPYPNRQEKLRLCQLTQLTYTQVHAYTVRTYVAYVYAGLFDKETCTEYVCFIKPNIFPHFFPIKTILLF